ncbi:MAG TPA: NAD(P)H-dependent oxidoreductase [Candidatus Omnitrophota bacterium]|nr:NAD(P)H-dependent oxidoreductase [Candidatus Omnitrophota bacterium]HPB67836.1 NAD(P)H-dependent oxidoreductase [Candidatus Omnitrophota bacterium]HQO58760.1 NAD(P)H-dependent oxidoreductase [Candidatus Omnitrophota bacterium]
MKFLIVYGHPYPRSFNHAIMETFRDRVKENGQEVVVRDLYAIRFDPVLKEEELEGFKKNVYPEDVRREQDYVRWADTLVIISPVWWGGLTSITRGYFDRVFSLNFAYRETAAGPQGLLNGKRGYLINTIGAPVPVYEQAGLIGSMKKTIGDIVFDFCSITRAGHKFFGAVGSCSDAERKDMLEDVRRIADDLSRITG